MPLATSTGPPAEGAPTWNTDAPLMRWSRTEITLQAIVYVPSPRPPSRGMTTLTSTTLGAAETGAPVSSSTVADPPVSDTCSLNRSTASGGASSEHGAVGRRHVEQLGVGGRRARRHERGADDGEDERAQPPSDHRPILAVGRRSIHSV